MYLFLSNFEIDDVELFNINYFFLSKGMWLKISGDKDAIDLGYIFIFLGVILGLTWKATVRDVMVITLAYSII